MAFRLAGMTDAELLELDASSVLPLLRSGALGARTYAELLLQRIGTHASLNAMVHVDPEGVLSAARASDDMPPSRRGILHGLPLIVKDNIDVSGMPCTAGSPALAEHVPRHDASCVASLVAAGAMVLGKANLHEFALGVTSANRTYGAVRNPYDVSRIAGGSSGGTAAALAARLAPAGLGTDTGGSIRIPAAHCGVVGFRPTTGRWPGTGVIPISVPSRDTAAPMARSVADCALIDAVVCGVDPVLPTMQPRGLRLGVPPAFWSNLHSGLAHQLERTLGLLEAAGVELVPVDVGIDLHTCSQTGLTIAMAENLPALRAYFAMHDLPFDALHLACAVASPDVRAILTHLAGGAEPSQQAYELALAEVRQTLKPAWSRCFSSHRLDALVMPTTPLPAARVGEEEQIQMDGRTWPTFDTHVRLCGPASIIGLPSVSLPAGMVKVDDVLLPVGLMLDGPPMSDRRLLAVAAALHPFLDPTPPPP